MLSLPTTVGDGFAQWFKHLSASTHALADVLSEEQFWTKPFSHGNSFGHLVLHLTGNLSYYIGAQIAMTGYTRDRPREFNEANNPPKDEVLRRMDEAVDMVISTIRAQTEDDWSKEYSATGAEGAVNRFGMFLKCVMHFDHHVGQMIYIAREITGDNDVSY